MVDVVNTGLSWSSMLMTGGEIAYLMSAMPSLSSWVVMKNCKGEALVRIFCNHNTSNILQVPCTLP